MNRRLSVILCTSASAIFFACSDSSSGKTRSYENPVMTCTEIMYNPIDSGPEFAELKLSGRSLSSMSDVRLRLDGAVEFTFPDEPLENGEIIVVTNDSALFRTTYPNFAGRLFQWDSGFKLSNSGDVLEIKIDGPGDFDARFDSKAPWPSLADGNGSSLVYVGSNPAYAESWAASSTVGGNPGSADDPYYKASSVRINEILPTYGTDAAWIELYNAGDSDVDVGGWKIVRPESSDSIRYIPAGNVVAANGYLVLSTLLDSDGAEQAVNFVARGEAVYLREILNGAETGVESGLEYAALAEGKSAGVVALSDSSTEQGELLSPTPGAVNSAISMGPVYISEVYYNPPDGDVEFLEIVNKSDSTVTLSAILDDDDDAAGWKIVGIGFEFSDRDTLASGEIALLIPKTYTAADGYSTPTITADEFRTKWSLPETVQIFQYSGKLSNRGEEISIKQPSVEANVYSAKLGRKTTKTFYRQSDAILYSDDGLWPEEADGEGYSLQRVDFSVSGNEPSNWTAKEPTPGAL